jgi:hypothetical protein
MPSKGFEPAISANQEALDLRLRPHDLLDRFRINNSLQTNNVDMQATSQMHEDKFVFRNSNIYDMIQK